MAGEGVNVGNELGGLGRSGGAAYAPAKGDGLAGYLALEGAEDEFGGGGVVEGVETCGY